MTGHSVPPDSSDRELLEAAIDSSDVSNDEPLAILRYLHGRASYSDPAKPAQLFTGERLRAPRLHRIAADRDARPQLEPEEEFQSTRLFEALWDAGRVREAVTEALRYLKTDGFVVDYPWYLKPTGLWIGESYFVAHPDNDEIPRELQ